MQKHCSFEHFFKFLSQIGPKGTLIVTLHLMMQQPQQKVVGAKNGQRYVPPKVVSPGHNLNANFAKLECYYNPRFSPNLLNKS